MGSRGSRIAYDVQQRIKRLSTPAPSLQKYAKITNESAVRLLMPLSCSAVNQEDADFAMHVLESVDNESCSKKVARFIANEVALGLKPNVNISLENYNISDENKKILSEAFSHVAVCQRIINNQETLDKRFNTKRIIDENCYRVDKIINELCELIDTYSVPDQNKYNVALENIVYMMRTNNIHIPSDDYVVDKITEYFLFRDETIKDSTYQAYQEILKENTVLSLDVVSETVKAFLESDGSYYTNQINDLFDCAEGELIKEYFAPAYAKIRTEKDADEYIQMVDSFNDPMISSKKDRQILLHTVKNIPNCTKCTSTDFVNIKAKEILGNDVFDGLDSMESIISNTKAINEKPELFTVADYYKNYFSESDGYASTEDIPKVIAKFKAEQDKSPNKIVAFIRKLHTKNPEAIIDGVPSIMSAVRAGILVCIAGFTPIGPVLAAITGLVSWLISKDINEKEAKRLKNCIHSEIESVDKKLNKASGKSKDELKKYKDNLEACEKKVQDYLETIANDNEEKDDFDNDDDMGFDDDMDFEFESTQGIIDVANFLAICESIAEDIQVSYSNTKDMILEASDVDCLDDLMDIVRESTLSTSEFNKYLNEAIQESGFVKTSVSLARGRDYYNESESMTFPTAVRKVMATKVANDIIKEASEIVEEKVNLNTVKLALQNGKAKLKDLSMKEKSMWQAADAQASGMMKSIEKAMTSDRREAIIKGNIIPRFSSLIKSSMALAAVGIMFGPAPALIAAIGALGTSTALNTREKKLLLDEIDTELKVVEKQIDIAQNDGDMNQYRFLLNYQKKLTREYQRIKYGLKVSGRDIPSSTLPGRGGND